METITLKQLMDELAVGRILAERYARESGALLPRVKNGPYYIKKEAFYEWFRRSNNA